MVDIIERIDVINKKAAPTELMPPINAFISEPLRPA